MRIVSLLPSTTEIVFALGLDDALVAVTHECDYPSQAKALPVITSSALDHTDASSAQIDAAVRAQLRGDLSIYHLDHALLHELHPHLILTQALCEVCAVSFGIVEQAIAQHDSPPRVLSLEPTDLAGILGSILAVGRATDTYARAELLVSELKQRVDAVQTRAAQQSTRPRTLCLEWFEPLFGPGHWLPELVSLAGGTPGLGTAATPSQQVTWEAVQEFAPEVLILTACGFDLNRAEVEARRCLPQRPGWEELPAVRDQKVFLVDGNAYFSRPGPRIVDSLELLAALIHPDAFPAWGSSDDSRLFVP